MAFSSCGFVQFAPASSAFAAPKSLVSTGSAGVRDVAVPRRRVVSMVLSVDENPKRKIRDDKDNSTLDSTIVSTIESMGPAKYLVVPPLVAVAVAAMLHFGPPAVESSPNAPPTKVVQASSTLARKPEYVMSAEDAARIEEQTRLATTLEKELGVLQSKGRELKVALEANQQEVALTTKKIALAKDIVADTQQKVQDEQVQQANQWEWREVMNMRTALSVALVVTFSLTWVGLTRF
ncbi:hypothetical protein FVE85_0899 [Porphyridium purpureum]|uniref:Uncharacterized protein n=1 Tax=Porphyridium purpureum TaxID=35688 RepID=A0A5J4Z1L8_PORPP|nr:hypothetical protein FVE85_0899 [Porphyridium purpureum]|eukprot:POR3083..scf208_2